MSSIRSLLLVSVAGLQAGATAGAFAQQTGSSTGSPDLNACAAITATAERLACYDNLAGRSSGKSPSATPPATRFTPPDAVVAGAAPTNAGAARANATAAAGPAAAPSAHSEAATTTGAPASAGANAAAPATPTSAAPAIGTKEAFGLNAVEHSAAPKSAIESIKATIKGVSYDPYGRETITLEEGSVWILAGSDPLLAGGDSVTIKRAALGSFIMETPSGRTHRVKRLH